MNSPQDLLPLRKKVSAACVLAPRLHGDEIAEVAHAACIPFQVRSRLRKMDRVLNVLWGGAQGRKVMG